MSKNVQAFTLFNTLKAAGKKGVSKSDIAKVLGVKESSVPVYIFNMKKAYKAKFEVIKNGRQIVAYKLANADEVKIPQLRRNAKGVVKSVTKTLKKKASKTVKAAKVAKPKVVTPATTGEVPVLDADMEITEFSDSEFNDIRTSLGL